MATFLVALALIGRHIVWLVGVFTGLGGSVCDCGFGAVGTARGLGVVVVGKSDGGGGARARSVWWVLL